MNERADTDGRGEVLLRDVTDADLDTFFDQQRDAEANFMAAFTSKNPADRDAFDAHWRRILGDDTITNRAILCDGEIAGHIARFEEDGRPEVTYWLGKAFWGRGIATRALSAFLREIPARPLHARVAKDNAASRRVLQKCGFAVTGEDSGYAHARGAVTEEYVLTLP